MRTNVLWRKIARVILLIADELHISEEKALDRFYRSRTYEMLTAPRYGLQTMSDVYILDEYLKEAIIEN